MIEIKSGEQTLKKDCIVLCMVNAVVLAVCTRMYNGVFDLIHYPLSELGAFRTKLGMRNTLSQGLFNFLMLYNSLFFFFMRARTEAAGTTADQWFQVFCRTAGAGLVIIIYPYDLNNTFHSVGTAAMAFSIMMLSTLSLRNTAQLPPRVFCFMGWVLLIIYAAASAVDFSSKDVVQKPVILILGLNLLASSPFMRKKTKQVQSDSESESFPSGSAG